MDGMRLFGMFVGYVWVRLVFALVFTYTLSNMVESLSVAVALLLCWSMWLTGARTFQVVYFWSAAGLDWFRGVAAWTN